MKIILCPNPFRDKGLKAAKSAERLLSAAAFSCDMNPSRRTNGKRDHFNIVCLNGTPERHMKLPQHFLCQLLGKIIVSQPNQGTVRKFLYCNCILPGQRMIFSHHCYHMRCPQFLKFHAVRQSAFITKIRAYLNLSSLQILF